MNMPSIVEILPDVSKVYIVGTPKDQEFDDFYLQEWGFKGNMKDDEKPYWVQFKNETIETGVKFDLSPTQENIDEFYEMYYILTDLNQDKPMSEQYEFAIQVVNLEDKDEDEEEVFVFKYEQKDSNKAESVKVEKKKVMVTIDPPDRLRIFTIRFSEKIYMISNCTEWSQQNEGVDKLLIEYYPSEETLTILYDEDIEQYLTNWMVV